ncbi:MAG TPA: RNA polymerase sigma factor [Gemmatimonadaceae bacterium]|nr:RNA polymerase sigma factor [Gemmatimonadaceae bacterium]
MDRTIPKNGVSNLTSKWSRQRLAVDDYRVNESQLIAQVMAGDRLAGRALYDTHAPRLYALAYRMSGDAEKAREFTQDTFIRAFSRLSQFRGDAAFSTWLHRIMVTVVSNARRSEIRFGREVGLDEAQSLESHAPEAEPDLKECIAKALDKLSEVYRTTLIMHDIQGYTHAEIAGILGVPEGTCKSRLSAARAQMRQDLAAFKE